MKSILAISLLLLTCSIALGQTAGLKAAHNDKDEKELLKLEQEWGDVYKNGNTATLKRLLADDFIYTDGDGKLYNKEQYIELVLKGKVETYSLSETAVKIYGDTAILTAIWTDKSSMNGKDTSGTARFTDTFVKRNGRWLALASQDARIPIATATAEQEVRRVQQDYDKAWLQQDAAAFGRLLADDFTQIDFEGKVFSKAEVVANAKSGDVKFEVGQSEDVKVRVYGNTAMVNLRWTEKSTNKGKPVVAGTMQNTIVYVKRDGNWQVVSDQVTLIAAPTAKP